MTSIAIPTFALALQICLYLTMIADKVSVIYIWTIGMTSALFLYSVVEYIGDCIKSGKDKY